jgi:heptosyltransferase-2
VPRLEYLPDREIMMRDMEHKILVWLPSPMGDAVLCTGALRALREHFPNSRITYFANKIVREVLSPCEFNDFWLEQKDNSPFAIAKMLKERDFSEVLLFKNSFCSAFACFLAGIGSRIGYTRECRGMFLTEKLRPPKKASGRFKPGSMVDYYLAITSWLGCQSSNRKLELNVEPQNEKVIQAKFPQLAEREGPICVFVPGGAFGPSKCWSSERFARVAERLIDKYKAVIVVSVSPNIAEKRIAEQICNSSKNELINLGENPLSLGQLKYLFSIADLVIANDTGPRHIAIALRRKVITLFGPNDPSWTDTDYDNEIQIVGNSACSPCAKPVCKESQHFCMESITVDMVCQAAKDMLENNPTEKLITTRQRFKELSKSFFVDADYQSALSELGLSSIDDIFSFNEGTNLHKSNLGRYRTRLKFKVKLPSVEVFLKRYDSPPILVQLKKWVEARCKKSLAMFDIAPAVKLKDAGVNTPKTICYGWQWGRIFEKRSFCITEKIPNAESLERKFPECFYAEPTVENLKTRRTFIAELACFVRKFHQTGYRHRDLYLCHIFYDNNGSFTLIDLARVFKPGLLAERYRRKDIAQLFYSAPGKYFSRTDRMRFYFHLTGRAKLHHEDKTFIRKVISKAQKMASHDIRHGREVPFKR